MAQKKPVVKEVIVKNVRGIDFSCSKALKMIRGICTKEQFKTLVLNEKKFVLNKKKRGNKTET